MLIAKREIILGLVLSFVYAILSNVANAVWNHIIAPDFEITQHEYPAPVTYPVPPPPPFIIQYEHPASSVEQGDQIVLQDPYAHESLIQPTGVEHDKPVVPLKHLADNSGLTQSKRHSVVKTRSIDRSAGAYRQIMRQFHG